MSTMRAQGRVVVAVLIASVVVAVALGAQAIAAARSRQAVSDAMLRQYAELAAWELSREARKDIDAALVPVLNEVAHPKQHQGRCNCAEIKADALLFEVTPGGPAPRSPSFPPDLLAQLAPYLPNRDSQIENARVRILPGGRLLATKWEPHAGDGGAHVGLVTSMRHLTRILERTFARAPLLPPQVTKGLEAKGLIDVQVTDDRGAVVFASADTVAGSQPVESNLLPGSSALRVRASMTPAFVAALGPEHGGGANGALIVGLVIVNVLMVAIGLWQLGRERELARMRSDFVAGVSHELRTPLAQIRMFTDTLLLDRIRTPSEGRRALEIISRETRRLGQLVENVLYFHRHQRIPAPPVTEPLDLASLSVEVVEGFRPLAASRRIGVSIRTSVTELVVDGNGDALRQVLLNLLDNAVKFGPPDAVIDVSLERVGASARLCVQDRGRGVPPADRERIFQPYERGGGAAHAGGAGIGLAVASQIVRDHRGSISVEDAASGGARFVVCLPLIEDDTRQGGVMSLAG